MKIEQFFAKNNSYFIINGFVDIKTVHFLKILFEKPLKIENFQNFMDFWRCFYLVKLEGIDTMEFYYYNIYDMYLLISDGQASVSWALGGLG